MSLKTKAKTWWKELTPKKQEVAKNVASFALGLVLGLIWAS